MVDGQVAAMRNRGRPLSPFLAWVMLCCSVGFVAASCAPLWKVARTATGFADRVGRGSFWEFVGELPLALENKLDPDSFTLPGYFLGYNVRTTVLVLAAGAYLGCLAAWSTRLRGNENGLDPTVNRTRVPVGMTRGEGARTGDWRMEDAAGAIVGERKGIPGETPPNQFFFGVLYSGERHWPSTQEYLMLSKEQAAAKIDVSLSTLDRMLKKGGYLHPLRIGKKIVFEEKQLEKDLDEMINPRGPIALCPYCGNPDPALPRG
jgi:hypothetical protein